MRFLRTSILKKICERLLLNNALNVYLRKLLLGGEHAMKPPLVEVWQNRVPDSSPDEISPAKMLLLELTHLAPSFCELFLLHNKTGSQFFSFNFEMVKERIIQKQSPEGVL